MAVILALVTAIALGFDFYFIKKGLIETPYPLIATFITLTINFSFLVSFLLSLAFMLLVLPGFYPIKVLKLWAWRYQRVL